MKTGIDKSVTVIIPTLNEGKCLPRLLESIRKQDFDDFEIVVADAHSTDDTVQTARRYGARVVVGGLPGVGRNRGAKQAQGEFLFFLDADVKLPRDFLRKAYNEMQERFLDLATCEMRPLSSLRLDRVLYKGANLIIKMGQHTRYPHAPGYCILISKRLFERIGGFDESLRLAEDHDLVVRASRFRPLRVLTSTTASVDVRRLRKEGRLNYAAKNVHVEIHRLLLGKIVDDNTIEYQFGDFGRVNTASKLRKVEQRIHRMEMQYRALLRGHEKRQRAFAARRLRIIGNSLRVFPQPPGKKERDAAHRG
jgi:glycosyltransferase involved in cell wall biosynthesis